MQKAGKPERGFARDKMLQRLFQVPMDPAGMLRRNALKVLEHAVHVFRGLDGMGEDIIDMVLAGSEVPERPELRQELFQEPQRLHKQEMPPGAFYREYLEELVPDALRRRRGDKGRP